MPLQRWKPLDKHQAPRITSRRGGQPLLDEVVFKNVDLHIERMHKDHYWMGITEPGGRALHFGFHREGQEIEFLCAEQLPPGGAGGPEPTQDREPPPPPRVVSLEVPGDIDLAALDEFLQDLGCKIPEAERPAWRG